MGYVSYLEDIHERLIGEFKSYFGAKYKGLDDTDLRSIKNIVDRIFEQAVGNYRHILTDPNITLVDELSAARTKNREMRDKIQHLNKVNLKLRSELKNANDNIEEHEYFRKNVDKYPPFGGY